MFIDEKTPSLHSIFLRVIKYSTIYTSYKSSPKFDGKLTVCAISWIEKEIKFQYYFIILQKELAKQIKNLSYQ